MPARSRSPTRRSTACCARYFYLGAARATHARDFSGRTRWCTGRPDGPAARLGGRLGGEATARRPRRGRYAAPFPDPRLFRRSWWRPTASTPTRPEASSRRSRSTSRVLPHQDVKARVAEIVEASRRASRPGTASAISSRVNGSSTRPSRATSLPSYHPATRRRHGGHRGPAPRGASTASSGPAPPWPAPLRRSRPVGLRARGRAQCGRAGRNRPCRRDGDGNLAAALEWCGKLLVSTRPTAGREDRTRAAPSPLLSRPARDVAVTSAPARAQEGCGRAAPARRSS